MPELEAGGLVLAGTPGHTASHAGDAPEHAYDALLAAAADHEPEDARVGGEDPFNIVYSSGTTGAPKGIVHTHRIRAMYATLFASAFRMHPESVVLHTGSIVFNGAFVTLMPWLYLGATYVLGARFDPEEVIATIGRERVTHTMLVPSQIVALLASPGFASADLDSLEMVLTLGAPLHLEHKHRLSERLPGRFHELYGLTEGFVTILDREDYPRKPDSVGVPPAFFEMRVVDDAGRDLPAAEVGEQTIRGLISQSHRTPTLQPVSRSNNCSPVPPTTDGQWCISRREPSRECRYGKGSQNQ